MPQGSSVMYVTMSRWYEYTCVAAQWPLDIEASLFCRSLQNEVILNWMLLILILNRMLQHFLVVHLSFYSSKKITFAGSLLHNYKWPRHINCLLSPSLQKRFHCWVFIPKEKSAYSSGWFLEVDGSQTADWVFSEKITSLLLPNRVGYSRMYLCNMDWFWSSQLSHIFSVTHMHPYKIKALFFRATFKCWVPAILYIHNPFV